MLLPATAVKTSGGGGCGCGRQSGRGEGRGLDAAAAWRTLLTFARSIQGFQWRGQEEFVVRAALDEEDMATCFPNHQTQHAMAVVLWAMMEAELACPAKQVQVSGVSVAHFRSPPAWRSGGGDGAACARNKRDANSDFRRGGLSRWQFTFGFLGFTLSVAFSMGSALTFYLLASS